MNDFVILCLSDIHYERGKLELDILKKDFLEKLKLHINKYPAWQPQYIIISGDIASEGSVKEYNEISKFLKDVCQICGLRTYQVIMAPGNHDMSFEKINFEYRKGEIGRNGKKVGKQKVIEKNYKLYKNCIDSLFDLNDIQIFNKNKEIKKNFLDNCLPYFQNYINFRKKFFSKGNRDKSEIDRTKQSVIKRLKYLTNFQVFDSARIVFWELNSSWLSFIDHDNLKGTMRLGSPLIKEFCNRLWKYKKEGYFIITVFHHSLSFLASTEFQPTNNKFHPYDALLEYSDLLICGHEHGSEAKLPDYLGNSAQLVMCGSFYCKQRKLMDNIDSSALFIRISRIHRRMEIHKVKARYYSDIEWDFTFPEHIESFPIYIPKQVLNAEGGKGKAVTFSNPILYLSEKNYTDAIPQQAVRFFFGKNYRWENFILHSNDNKFHIPLYVYLLGSQKIKLPTENCIVLAYFMYENKMQGEELFHEFCVEHEKRIGNGSLLTTFFLINTNRNLLN